MFTSATFRLGHMALSARLFIPVAFRLAAFASRTFPFPLGVSVFLAVGLLVSQTPSGLPRSTPARSDRGGRLLYCGSLVSFHPSTGDRDGLQGKKKQPCLCSNITVSAVKLAVT